MTTDSFSSSGTWTCPAGITKVDITLLGAGGGGGNYNSNIGGAGGGAGSSATYNLVSVAPGNTYSIVVGTGGGATEAGGQSSGLGYSAAGGAGGATGGAGGGPGLDGAGAGGGAGGAYATPPPGCNGGNGAAGAGGGGGGGQFGGVGGGSGGSGGNGAVTITYTIPSSAFTGTPLTGTKPVTVNYTGPAGLTTYAWTMGDGDTSSNQSPQHTYTGVGTYTVILATTNNYGYSATTKIGYVTVFYKKSSRGDVVVEDWVRGV